MGPEQQPTDGAAFEKSIEDLFSVDPDDEDGTDEEAAEEEKTEDGEGQ